MGQLKRAMDKKIRTDLILTPRIEERLAEGIGGALVDPLVFHDHLMPVMVGPPASRNKRFGPSGIYGCHRRQVFAFIGVPEDYSPKPQLQLIFNDGHWRHLRWQAFLLNAGIIDAIEVKRRREELRLGGSLDGVNTEEKFIVEIKGTAKFSMARHGPFKDHLWQAQAYLMLYPEMEKVAFLYEDKASQDYIEHVVESQDDLQAEIADTLRQLNDAVDVQELPPIRAECEEQTGATYSTCPYRDSCHRHDWDTAVLATPRRRRLRVIDDSR